MAIVNSNNQGYTHVNSPASYYGGELAGAPTKI
jgi:hypothetical protein